MNIICENCDTRIRLNLCNGKIGEFKYCYRPTGSLNNINNETILPFNKISEIKTPFDNAILKGTFEISDYGGRMKILTAEWLDRKRFPVGYITY